MKAGHSAFVSEVANVRLALLDTSACIYFLNRKEPWYSLVNEVLDRGDVGLLRITIPGVVLMELLVDAFRNNDEFERRRIETLVEGTPFIRLLPISRQILMVSAEIRGKLGARLADAMVIGSACVSGTDVIIGNDRRFKMLRRAEGFTMATAPDRALPQYLHLGDFVE